ncbi:MAG: glucosaminidase domain-containing protein [Ignavibacteria bacterium]|nr:glucosaminidase domain-containing protein [Ignavibacteria bacterium]
MNLEQRIFAGKIINQAYEAKKITGLPASILASQCILETGWGKHIPIDINTGGFSYNLFGIKARALPYVLSYSPEFEDGRWVVKLSKFRKYKNYTESLIDYGNLILGSARYLKAVAYRNDARIYIWELFKAGYATDPKYPEKVLRIAEQCKFLPEIKV